MVVNNHFPCDCHIHNLLEGPLANGSAADFAAKNYCISPLHFNGMAISSINLNTIGRCQDDISRDNWEAPAKATTMSSSNILRWTLSCGLATMAHHILAR